ncbi:MAG: response regulator [Gemmatimonadota bacterium]
MKALVIDDDAASRRILSRLLSRFFPHAVAEAQSGEEALELMAKEIPIIVFTDLEMPGIGGIEMIRRLRADPALAHLPVVAVSASNERETVTQVVGLGVTDYLVKPIDLVATFRRLERIVPAAVKAAPRVIAPPGPLLPDAEIAIPAAVEVATPDTPDSEGDSAL